MHLENFRNALELALVDQLQIEDPADEANQ